MNGLQEAYSLLHKGSLALSRMERAGLRVDKKHLDHKIKSTEDEIKETERRMVKDKTFNVWQRTYGSKTNLESHHQLKNILYDKLGYKSEFKTASGKPKTDADALEDIDLPFVRDFQNLQDLRRILSNYLRGIEKEMVRRRRGYYTVHPVFNLHTATTYRSSADSPTFHSMPKRDPEMAAAIRPCFLPHPGHRLVEIDFSQLEVRVAAGYSKDANLIRYVQGEGDMHHDAAKKIFMLNDNQVDKRTTRDSAKNQFVFPQFYGSASRNCARNIWKSMSKRAFQVDGKSIFKHLKKKGIIERGECVGDGKRGTFERHLEGVQKWMWEEQFKTYSKWKHDWFKTYQSRGYFDMYTGFHVKIRASWTEATNWPIQGSAFHCLLWCIIELDKLITKYKMDTMLVGEIHDSLIASVPDHELETYLDMCVYVMTVALRKHYEWINVPFQVTPDVTEIDENWYSAKEWAKKEGEWGLTS